jgi:hypothetical protein
LTEFFGTALNSSEKEIPAKPWRAGGESRRVAQQTGRLRAL